MIKCVISTLSLILVFLDCFSQDLVPFRAGNFWGYKNKQGEVKIEPQFQYAASFKDNVAIVAKNEKLGAIDKANNLLIPFSYEFLTPIDEVDYLFGYRAKYFGEYIIGLMTRDEKVKIPAEYSYISKYRNTYTVTKNNDSTIGKSDIGDVRSIQSSQGLFDSDGKTIIPCNYDHIEWICDSLLDVTTGGLGIKHALFTARGKQLTGFEYMVFGNFIEGVAKARIGDKFGFIYPTGKIAVPITFDYCEDFRNGYAIIKQQEKWGAINREGKIIIRPKFSQDEVKTILKVKYSR